MPRYSAAQNSIYLWLPACNVDVWMCHNKVLKLVHQYKTVNLYSLRNGRRLGFLIFVCLCTQTCNADVVTATFCIQFTCRYMNVTQASSFRFYSVSVIIESILMKINHFYQAIRKCFQSLCLFFQELRGIMELKDKTYTTENLADHNTRVN